MALLVSPPSPDGSYSSPFLLFPVAALSLIVRQRLDLSFCRSMEVDDSVVSKILASLPRLNEVRHEAGHLGEGGEGRGTPPSPVGSQRPACPALVEGCGPAERLSTVRCPFLLRAALAAEREKKRLERGQMGKANSEGCAGMTAAGFPGSSG